jgi:hypothetical protein
MSSKGFLNLNRFKSSKAIKQEMKRSADESRNKPSKRDSYSHHDLNTKSRKVAT